MVAPFTGARIETASPRAHQSLLVEPLNALSSIKQPPDIGHRPEQLHWLVLQRQKALPFIEAAGAVILRVDDHRERGDLASRGAVKCIGQQKPPITLPLLAVIDSKATQERCRNQWISRQL